MWLYLWLGEGGYSSGDKLLPSYQAGGGEIAREQGKRKRTDLTVH
jgi:hypothetical protein